MPVPTTEKLELSRDGYWDVRNFPNCVGALDGRHFSIKSHRFLLIKKFFSIVLQGVADPDYKFLTVDVGAKGSQNVGGTFGASSLSKSLRDNTFNMPLDSTLPNSTKLLPNVLTADDAYPLKTLLLKGCPYLVHVKCLKCRYIFFKNYLLEIC